MDVSQRVCGKDVTVSKHDETVSVRLCDVRTSARPLEPSGAPSPRAAGPGTPGGVTGNKMYPLPALGLTMKEAPLFEG